MWVEFYCLCSFERYLFTIFIADFEDNSFIHLATKGIKRETLRWRAHHFQILLHKSLVQTLETKWYLWFVKGFRIVTNKFEKRRTDEIVSISVITLILHNTAGLRIVLIDTDFDGNSITLPQNEVIFCVVGDWWCYKCKYFFVNFKVNIFLFKKCNTLYKYKQQVANHFYFTFL